MNTLSSLPLNRIASFLTPSEVNTACKAFRHEPEVTRQFLQSLMRLTIFCTEYGQFPKAITWKVNPGDELNSEVYYVCTNFRQIEKRVEDEFRMSDSRYKAEVSKLVAGRRVVVKTLHNSDKAYVKYQ